MRQKISWIALIAMGLVSCGGADEGTDGGPAAAPASESEPTVSGDASDAGSGEFTRESFVLCPALEDHRDELASIVGFEQDPDRDLSVLGSECSIHGDFGAFARVSLAPAIQQSVAMHVRGFDAEAQPAPELGPDAVFVDVNLQPHVVFSMGPLIIDVDASNVETPSRETMIELALRVREILTEANS